MSPGSSGRQAGSRGLLLPFGRTGAGRVLAALFLSVALLGTVPAAAVIGGTPETGPLSRSVVMVISSRGGVCSGVVLAPDAVLTAAHCLDGGGQRRIHYKDAGGAPVLVEPATVALHPRYDAGALEGRRQSVDMALVRVARPLPFTAAALSAGRPAKGAPVTVAGFGLLREGGGDTTGTFRSAALAVVEPFGRGRVLLWASSPSGAGACQGDSGGPLLDAAGSVVAVTSWSAGAARGGGYRAGCGAMTQGVLVSPQRPWIDKTLAEWGRKAEWR